MPRQIQPVELNTFIGGLVTEASPLTFPNNASLDEENFVLNKDGSRSRRLGMMFDDNYQTINTTQSIGPNGELVTGSFKWSNAGGLSTNTILCVQIGSSIDFFQANSSPLSGGKFFSYVFPYSTGSNRFSYASVDGKLVVATGSKDVSIFTFDTTKIDITQAITVETRRLLIRDLFGLDSTYSDGRNLREGSPISIRPVFGGVGPSYIYNLRNQGWAIPHAHWDGNDYVQDTIIQFANVSKTTYPSNADTISAYIYANTDNKGGTKTIKRFNPSDCVANPPSNMMAPVGSFIIDALDRGSSRMDAVRDMQNKYPENDIALFNQALKSYQEDTTPGGATVVCEFAGRVFYGGFSGEVIGGDSHSPKMSSYILFSQLVRGSAAVNLCYQAADPTDNNMSDLVDTDGGFLRIEGAYGILGMSVLQNSLFVFATNGVWTITGGSNNGFTATNYQVSKLTNSGCVGPGSIVTMQDSIFYWGLDGIYSITRNQYGDFKSDDISLKTIKKFYMSIPEESVRRAEGVYDSYTSTVRWLYNNYVGSTDDTIEVNIDVTTGAYFKHRIRPLSGGLPIVVRGVQTDPVRVSTTDNNVMVGPDDVIVSDMSQVVLSISTSEQGVKEVRYFIVTSSSPNISYTFGNYTQSLHYDWSDVDGVGIDAPAFLITGVLSGGDYQRNKQIVYQTTHFKKTEETLPTVFRTSVPYPVDVTERMTSQSNVTMMQSISQPIESMSIQSRISGLILTQTVKYSSFSTTEQMSTSSRVTYLKLTSQVIRTTMGTLEKMSTSSRVTFIKLTVTAGYVSYTTPPEKFSTSSHITGITLK